LFQCGYDEMRLFRFRPWKERAWLLNGMKEFELERKVAVDVPTESAC